MKKTTGKTVKAPKTTKLPKTKAHGTTDAGKTMICLILDRSGSMGGREKDVIGGVNTFITEQQKLPNPACAAFVRFDSPLGAERFRPMMDLKSVTPMTSDEYVPRGGTPLLDAVGTTITALDADWKTEKPARCIVVIVTDGQENCSREYTKAKIREMIEAREKSGWSFIYLGANVDSFAEAAQMGIAAINTANYINTAAGTQALYASLSASVGNMRSARATSANLGGNINEDGTLTKK